MRHDYRLPADWPDMSPSERSAWMTQDRARRQAMRQDTATGRRLREDFERVERRLEARSETIDVEDFR